MFSCRLQHTLYKISHTKNLQTPSTSGLLKQATSAAPFDRLRAGFDKLRVRGDPITINRQLQPTNFAPFVLSFYCHSC